MTPSKKNAKDFFLFKGLSKVKDGVKKIGKKGVEEIKNVGSGFKNVGGYSVSGMKEVGGLGVNGIKSMGEMTVSSAQSVGSKSMQLTNNIRPKNRGYNQSDYDFQLQYSLPETVQVPTRSEQMALESGKTECDLCKKGEQNSNDLAVCHRCRRVICR